jgi:hypothetical protein
MPRLELRDFDGDLPALSTMAREAWLEEYGASTWPDLYEPKLASHYLADVPDPRFLIAAYEGARLVAFVANLPRTYRLNGRPYRGVVSNMLVARTGYRGAAVYVTAESLARNREYSADLAVMTLERNHRSSQLFRGGLQPTQPLTVVRTMLPFAHAIDLSRIAVSEALPGYQVPLLRLVGAHRRPGPPPAPGIVRAYRDADLAQAEALLDGGSDRNRLVRVYPRSSLARQLCADGVAATIVYEWGGVIRGFIAYTIRRMVSPRGSDPWVWVEISCWEGCSSGEKLALLAGLWDAGREAGCIGILAWDKGCSSIRPLLSARFVPYLRPVDAMVWTLNPGLSLQSVRGISDQVV